METITDIQSHKYTYKNIGHYLSSQMKASSDFFGHIIYNCLRNNWISENEKCMGSGVFVRDN